MPLYRTALVAAARARRVPVRTREEGVSLVELLIAMMLMLVVMGAIYGVWSGLERTYVFAEDDMVAQAEARLALGEIVEFIRTARVPDSVSDDALDTVIPFANPYEIWMWTDVDRDVNHDLELIRFLVTLDNGKIYLIRQESLSGDGVFDGAPVRVVNQNIRNDDSSIALGSVNPAKALFTYYDSTSSTPLVADQSYTLQPSSRSVDVTKIRSIGVKLLVDIDPSRAPIVHELSSVVQPRNLRQY